MNNCHSDKVFVLYRVIADGQKEALGWYDTLPDACCAFEAEREKEDGIRLEIRMEARQ